MRGVVTLFQGPGINFDSLLYAGADFILAENKFVSALHCVFMRGEGGEALLKDVSTNGTLLNGSRLEKNMQVSCSNSILSFVLSPFSEANVVSI